MAKSTKSVVENGSTEVDAERANGSTVFAGGNGAGQVTTGVPNDPTLDPLVAKVVSALDVSPALLIESVPSPERREARNTFLRALRKALVLKKCTTIGNPALDEEIIMCWGPYNGPEHAEPFMGFECPARFAVKSPKLQSGPGKVSGNRPLRSDTTGVPSAWGSIQLHRLIRTLSGDTSGLIVPAGLYDDAKRLLTPVAVKFDDLPTDLAKTRAIWAVWKELDPKGTKGSTLTQVIKIFQSTKLDAPTDQSRVVVVAEGITRQV